MSLEYLLDVAIQIEQPNFPQGYLDRKPEDNVKNDPAHHRELEPCHTQENTSQAINNPPTDLESAFNHEYGARNMIIFNNETSLLKPVFHQYTTDMYRKAEATRRRRGAIERRNARRNIVPKQDEEEEIAVSIDRNKTKNRISAASYRENRDKRVSFIQNEIKQLQIEFPHIQSKPWTPMKKPKSAIREGESKEEYRKRTNRESAADSRFQQQQKLQYLTRELARLRALAQHHRAHNE